MSKKHKSIRPSTPEPEHLRPLILEAIDRTNLPRFELAHDSLPDANYMYWDEHRSPDIAKFLTVAKAADAKLILYWEHHLQDFETMASEAMIDAAGLEPEDYREYTRALANIRSHTGELTRVGIGFTSNGTHYLMDFEAEWYAEFQTRLRMLRVIGNPENFDLEDLEDEDEDNDGFPPSRGGYFSKN